MKTGKLKITLLFAVLVMLLVFPSIASANGRGDGPIIYVRSQGLYYDSIVTTDPLPMEGKFQKLEMVDGQLETDFGPGDHGFYGGRWWMDVNGNGEMDAGDHFFSCPLLGPGRETP